MRAPADLIADTRYAGMIVSYNGTDREAAAFAAIRPHNHEYVRDRYEQDQRPCNRRTASPPRPLEPFRRESRVIRRGSFTATASYMLPKANSAARSARSGETFPYFRALLVLPVRIELTTSALPRMRSTTELRQQPA